MWREGLYLYGLLNSDHQSPYRHHPAFKEFATAPNQLLKRLYFVREEMLNRGYHPKELPPELYDLIEPYPKEWKTLEEQIEILKNKRNTIKSCKCKI